MGVYSTTMYLVTRTSKLKRGKKKESLTTVQRVDIISSSGRTVVAVTIDRGDHVT